MTSIPQVLQRAAQQHRDAPALVIDATGERFTFVELRTRVLALAGWLKQQHVRRGERIAVQLPNNGWWPVTWLACAEIGAVVVPIHSQARAMDLSYVLDDAQVSWLISLSRVVDGASVPVLQLPELLPEAPIGSSMTEDVSAETLLSVQYTSGSTGHPKGCLLTHRYWIGIAEQAVANDPGMRTDDVLLTAQPFSYIDPQWHLVTALLLGCPLVLVDAFHPSTFLDTVVKHGVTVFYCLGVMPALLLTQDLSAENQLRFVLCSGIPAAQHRELEQRLGVPWFELYGSTELGGAAIGVSRADHGRTVGTGVLGRPLPGFDVRIEEGELLVRSPNFMTGYWTQAHGGVDPRHDGWFRTGDLVKESDGLYSFLGRSHDGVRRSGENISAAEVEAVIATASGVDLAAVIAAPDALRGEEGHAYVQGKDLDPEVIAEHCLQRIARFKVPRYWSFGVLPLTPSGKVAKNELRAAANESPLPYYDRDDRRWHQREKTA